MRQLNSNEQDGVNGVTECPIAPGDSKTYRFQTTEYGTTWYHSHFSAQWGDGVQGPIIIHGPSSANYDEEIGTIIVSDTYNLTTFQEAHFAERTGPPAASNYLLNGQNVKPDGSAGQRSVWTVQKGKKYLFRFINTSVDNHFKIMIDNHIMTVIQSDFVPIEPYNTTSIDLGIGMRPRVGGSVA
jgi:FtsP/CotA-like multicopper oxidase with cupredoxin domain